MSRPSQHAHAACITASASPGPCSLPDSSPGMAQVGQAHLRAGSGALSPSSPSLGHCSTLASQPARMGHSESRPACAEPCFHQVSAEQQVSHSPRLVAPGRVPGFLLDLTGFARSPEGVGVSDSSLINFWSTRLQANKSSIMQTLKPNFRPTAATGRHWPPLAAGAYLRSGRAVSGAPSSSSSAGSSKSRSSGKWNSRSSPKATR